MDNLLSIKQVADHLGVQVRTLHKWIKDGKISALKLPNGEWRMKEAHLENWLNKRTIKASTF